jgi:hypothetical protein
MTGLSIMECRSDFDAIAGGPELLALTEAQAMGEACAICHARWPRPRIALGILDDGGTAYGCDECAALDATAWSDSTRSSVPALASL